MDIRDELNELQEKIDNLTEQLGYAHLTQNHELESKVFGERALLIRRVTELSKELEIWDK